MLNIRRVGALAALAAAGMAALYGWVRPPAESPPIAVTEPQGVTSPTGNPRPTPAEPVLAAPAGGQSRPPSSPASAALLSAAPAAPRNQRDEVDQLLRRYATQPDPRLLVQAARLSDGCQLVRATLRVSEPEAATEELASPVAPGQRERAATLLAECADFAGQPVAAAQTEAWYLAAARAGNLEASARLLAQGKNPVAPAGAGVALDQLLAAGQPETFPDLGQALRVWTGNTVLEGKEVPVTVHEAAWHLAGCATTACPGEAFLLAYNCALGGLCSATNATGYIWLGGLAVDELAEATRLAGAIREAIARRDYAALGFVPAHPEQDTRSHP